MVEMVQEERPDLTRARGDFRYFCESFAGQTVTDAQARAVDEWEEWLPRNRAERRQRKRIIAIVAPRQTGKSRLLALYALWRAFRTPQHRVLIVSAGEDAARRLLMTAKQIVVNAPLLAGSVVDEFAGLLRLSNDSQIKSVPASERQIRGETAHTLIVDEAALVSDDILLGAAFPTTAAVPDAQIVVASSATTASGAYYDLIMQGRAGSEHVQAGEWTIEDAPWVTPSALAAMRVSMSEIRFSAEMLNQFASGADLLFSLSVLELVTADYRPTTLPTLTGPARVLGGVDWAAGCGGDHSAITAIGRVPGAVSPDGTPVFAVVLAHRFHNDLALNHVIEQIASSPAHWAGLTMELNGLGMPCAQDLGRKIRQRPDEEGGASPRRFTIVEPDVSRLYPKPKPQPSIFEKPRVTFSTRLAGIHVTAQSKAATYSALRLLIDRQQLILPASATDLLRELLLLRVDLSPSGTERIEASSGHDDQADSFCHGLMPYQDGKQWRTVLGDLVDRRRKLPAVAPPDVRMVRTGGGIEVPALPVFQSVAGPEITVPPGVNPGPARKRIGSYEINDGYPQGGTA